MTLFTDNPLERMMIQKPGDGGPGETPPPCNTPPRQRGGDKPAPPRRGGRLKKRARGGVVNRPPLPFPRAARAVPTTGSRPAWGTVSES